MPLLTARAPWIRAHVRRCTLLAGWNACPHYIHAAPYVRAYTTLYPTLVSPPQASFFCGTMLVCPRPSFITCVHIQVSIHLHTYLPFRSPPCIPAAPTSSRMDEFAPRPAAPFSWLSRREGKEKKRTEENGALTTTGLDCERERVLRRRDVYVIPICRYRRFELHAQH